jgi:transcriptional activator SPT7
MLLHALNENGADVESLDSYIKDDIERLGTKLNGIQQRMRLHLTDLLVRFPWKARSSRTL